MKTTAKNAIREESGKILILVLVLLVVGGLLLTPLLGLMSTGLVAGQVYEKKAAELYAADAGVEDAIWRIRNDPPELYPYHYPVPLSLNKKDVDVTIYEEYLGKVGCHKKFRYHITSEAGASDSLTLVNAVLSVSYLSLNFSGMLDYAIASRGRIGIGQEGEGGAGGAAPEVHGDVHIKDVWRFDGDEDWIKDPHKLYHQDERPLTWPTYEQLHHHYWKDVKHLAPYTDNRISVDDPRLGESSLWIPSSGTLEIKGSGSTTEISGTIYVKGHLLFQPTPAINIILGDKAVLLAEGNITDTPSLTVSGSGCIIAKGDITLKPMFSTNDGNDDAEDPDFVLILSLQGTTTLQPLGNFHGTVAGHSSVVVQPNNLFRWISAEGKGLNFPMGQDDDNDSTEGLPIDDLRIESWQIQQGGQ